MKLNQTGINYILVDVPSTYSGIFYKRKKENYLDKQLERSFRIASMMLRYALQNFKGVKRVVYSSCSKFPEETDNVVEDALEEVRDAYSLLDPKQMLWDEWRSDGESAEHSNRRKCLHIKPKLDLCEGYFIAVFERNPEVPIPRYVHRKEELFYEDEEDDGDYEDDYKLHEKVDEEYGGKSKSFPYKKSSPDQGVKVYKQQYYKPYDKHFKNNDHSPTKVKTFKSRATSSTPSQFNNYSNDFERETTHSQLYP